MLAIGCLALLVAAPVLAQTGEDKNPFLQFLFGWFPPIIIIGGWFYFMRRMGGKKLGGHVERSFEHMDRLEAQNEKILETLERIERHLSK